MCRLLMIRRPISLITSLQQSRGKCRVNNAGLVTGRPSARARINQPSPTLTKLSMFVAAWIHELAALD